MKSIIPIRKVARAAFIIPVLSVALAMGRDSSRFEKALLSFRFDDAYQSQIRALDLLSGEGMRATVYAITGYVDTPSYMTWKDLARIGAVGHEIGSHTIGHQSMFFMSGKGHDAQFRESREALEKKGFQPKSFAWPYGFRSIFFRERVQRFYGNAVDYPLLNSGDLNFRDGDPYNLKCVVAHTAAEFEEFLKKCVKSGAWMVVGFHRIGGEKGRYTVSIEEFAGMVRIASEYRAKGEVDIVTVSEGAESMAATAPAK